MGLEVLKEVLLGLLIMESNMKGKIRRRRPRTLKRIPSLNGFALFKRERERNRTKHNTTKNRKEKIEHMHKECMIM